MSSSRLFTAIDVAKRNEYIEAKHIERQAEVCRHLHPSHDIQIQPIAGGITIKTLPELVGKLNRTVGLGMDSEVEEQNLRDIEALIKPVGLDHQIHLCALARPSALQSLSSCGYVVRHVLNVYACTPDDVVSQQGRTAGEAGVTISRVAQQETEKFLQASVAGFADGGRSSDLLRLLARLAACRDDTYLYVATINKEIVGTAAMAVIDSPDGSVAHLYLDSTLPGYRGKGVHAALIRARVLEAHQLGVDLATMTTSAGSGSARSAERAGFRLAYTKGIFTKRTP
ncbi:hypothetical protein P170DRAFT_435191 [Aspergillus steynii IBT 23096]|uniref:N-acetyltransferase domain-containing protein n=1 Tax=Aspergillus steynii IBT 23096 TaxID=1392250 RepID=A0A2I2GAG8_9EURO|nr:uncharacterized protein P170DRAFT_435191 [Aspergillus steynii IBT 23096]PLB49873.1 hypothetical protein P170DRAFT_435191 [Aspergillus steynii IBT 23096]